MEIDSKVTFQARLEELELGELSQRFTDLNWDTYAKMAFAVPSLAPALLMRMFSSSKYWQSSLSSRMTRICRLRLLWSDDSGTNRTSSSSVVCARSWSDPKTMPPSACRTPSGKSVRTDFGQS